MKLRNQPYLSLAIMLNIFLMTCPQINQLFYIKENGIYDQVQTQLSIVSLKGLRMIWIQDFKS